MGGQRGREPSRFISLLNGLAIGQLSPASLRCPGGGRGHRGGLAPSPGSWHCPLPPPGGCRMQGQGAGDQLHARRQGDRGGEPTASLSQEPKGLRTRRPLPLAAPEPQQQGRGVASGGGQAGPDGATRSRSPANGSRRRSLAKACCPSVQLPQRTDRKMGVQTLGAPATPSGSKHLRAREVLCHRPP